MNSEHQEQILVGILFLLILFWHLNLIVIPVDSAVHYSFLSNSNI